jgi:putative flavoprotein involved in K+ transport
MLGAVVIGGGQAGLGASHHLARRGIEHVVLERGRIGESWRSQRWDSFVLNTPNWMSQLPGEADTTESRDTFLTGDAYVARLQAYADDRRIPIRTGMDVTAVGARTRGGGFVVTADHGGGTVEFETRNVIVASGLQRVPRVPAIARSLPDDIVQMHAASYRRPGDLPTGAVLVVGSAQTGVQVVEDLLEAARTVYLCTSAVGRVRRRYRGRDTFEWLVEAGFFDVPLERLTDPKLRLAKQPAISGVGRLGHTVSLQYLAERGAILLGRPIGIERDRLLLDDTLGANIAFGDRTSAETNHGLEDGIRNAGLEPPDLEPDPADAPHPDPTSVRSPTELDLEASAIGSVVWATGFGGDLGYLRLPVLDDTSEAIHQRGVAPVPGIHFLGFPWLSKRKSGIIYGIDEDAAFIADRVADRLSEVEPAPLRRG